ncbi:sensor histidine kinase [Acetivibrio cellulolyticus]|uniref:sensor histidine kinase n=1 Tax=Acetivibrio cellulolyticus TaxID=35830 RepID=UPI0002481C2D|nr:ATP-binding protein [Acetivibrio cellulolyticus]
MDFFQLYGGIIIRSTQFVFLSFIYKKNIPFSNFIFPKKENAIVSIGILQSFIFSFAILIPFQRGLINDENGIIVYQITIIVVGLLIIVLGVIDHKQRENLLKINYQFKIQEVNVENMENLIQILRKNNHDIGNHLNTMLAMVRSENPNSLEKLKEYIENLTENLKISYRSFDTGNDFVNGLLAVKNSNAIKSGIKLEVDFEDKLYAIDVKDNELVSIVSNIIDNAIYEIEKTPVCEKKYIAVSGYIVDNIYNLSICNNGPEIPVQVIKRIFEKGYSGKDTKDKEHGYGLYIVKQYVTENGGKISVSSDKDETEFLMKFPIVNGYKPLKDNLG